MIRNTSFKLKGQCKDIFSHKTHPYGLKFTCLRVFCIFLSSLFVSKARKCPLSEIKPGFKNLSALVHQGHNVSTFCTFHEKNGGICDIVPLNDGQAIIQ